MDGPKGQRNASVDTREGIEHTSLIFRTIAES